MVVVDEHEAARSSLRRILEQACEFRCVAAYAKGEEAISGALALGAEAALIDIQMRATSGIECLRRLKEILPELVVVLVTGVTDGETMAQAAAAGADGYLAKPFSLDQCLTTLRFAVHRSHASRPPVIVRDGKPRPQLTKREMEVMIGLAKGLLYKEIADQLGISFSAVHKHQHKIFMRLHVSNRTEAISKWRDAQQA